MTIKTEQRYEAEIERLREQLVRAKGALVSIAEWRHVNLQSEYEPALRDVIRCVSECAGAALDALTDEDGDDCACGGGKISGHAVECPYYSLSDEDAS